MASFHHEKFHFPTSSFLTFRALYIFFFWSVAGDITRIAYNTHKMRGNWDTAEALAFAPDQHQRQTIVEEEHPLRSPTTPAWGINDTIVVSNLWTPCMQQPLNAIFHFFLPSNTPPIPSLFLLFPTKQKIKNEINKDTKLHFNRKINCYVFFFCLYSTTKRRPRRRTTTREYRLATTATPCRRGAISPRQLTIAVSRQEARPLTTARIWTRCSAPPSISPSQTSSRALTSPVICQRRRNRWRGSTSTCRQMLWGRRATTLRA